MKARHYFSYFTDQLQLVSVFDHRFSLRNPKSALRNHFIPSSHAFNPSFFSSGLVPIANKRYLCRSSNQRYQYTDLYLLLI